MKCVVPTQIGWKKVAFFVAAFLQAMFGALTLVFHEEIFGSLLNSVSRTSSPNHPSFSANKCSVIVMVISF